MRKLDLHALERSLNISRSANVLLSVWERREGLPQLVDQCGFGILRLRVIHDIDIQGEDNQDTFSYMWKTWAESTQMRDRLHIAPTVDAVEFHSEEDDPVLLLPDYLAGLIHYRTTPSVIEKPKGLRVTDIDAFVAAIDCQSNVLTRKWSFVTISEPNSVIERDLRWRRFALFWPLEVKRLTEEAG